MANASVKGTPNTSTTTTVTIPTHAVGDLIIIFAYRDGSTTQPSKPAASGTVPTWTDIQQGTGANTNSSRLAYCVATATNHTSGTWTNATGMIAVVIQNQAASPIGGSAMGGGAASSQAVAPAITQQQTTGKALLLHFFGHRTVTSWGSAPSGYTTLASNATEVLLSQKNSSTSDGSVTQTATTSSSSGYRGISVEIKSTETSPTTTLSSPSDGGTVNTTTPALSFTGTDSESDDVTYEVQVDTANTFNSSSGTPTRIQQVSGANTTFASSVSASSISPTAGNALIAVVEADTVAQNGVTVADNNGNTWNRVISTSLAATFDLEVWVALNVNSGATIVTATDNGGGVDSLIIVEEWSGIATASAIDQSAGATGVSSTALNSGASGTTTQAVELVIGAGVASGNVSMTAGSGYTNLTKTNTTFSTLAIMSKVVSSTGTQTADMTSGASGSWVCQVATFKAGVGALIDKFSASDAGFSGSPDNTDPYTSGQSVTYTLQSALSNGTTYYWRARSKDPAGSNTYGGWATTRSFLVSTGGGSVVKDLIMSGLIAFPR